MKMPNMILGTLIVLTFACGNSSQPDAPPPAISALSNLEGLILNCDTNFKKEDIQVNGQPMVGDVSFGIVYQDGKFDFWLDDEVSNPIQGCQRLSKPVKNQLKSSQHIEILPGTVYSPNDLTFECLAADKTITRVKLAEGDTTKGSIEGLNTQGQMVGIATLENCEYTPVNKHDR